MVDLPKVDPDAVNDLLYLAKRLGGILTLIPVLEHVFSLDQAMAERRTQIVSLDAEVEATYQKKVKLVQEVENTRAHIAKLLQEAEAKKALIIADGEAYVKDMIARTRDEMASQVADLTAQSAQLDAEIKQKQETSWLLDRELTALQDKYQNVKNQLEEFRRTI